MSGLALMGEKGGGEGVLSWLGWPSSGTARSWAGSDGNDRVYTYSGIGVEGYAVQLNVGITPRLSRLYTIARKFDIK